MWIRDSVQNIGLFVLEWKCKWKNWLWELSCFSSDLLDVKNNTKWKITRFLKLYKTNFLYCFKLNSVAENGFEMFEWMAVLNKKSKLVSNEYFTFWNCRLVIPKHLFINLPSTKKVYSNVNVNKPGFNRSFQLILRFLFSAV